MANELEQRVLDVADEINAVRIPTNNQHCQVHPKHIRRWGKELRAIVAALQQAQQPDTERFAGCMDRNELAERLGVMAAELSRYSDGGAHKRIPGPSAGRAYELSVELRQAATALRESEEWRRDAVAQAMACDDAAVERALAYLAFEEDGAQWPDAYSEEEQAMERETMRGVLAAANCTTGPSAYCRACQAVGMGNCQHFDECSGATCITCHRPLNTTPPPLPEGVSKPKEA